MDDIEVPGDRLCMYCGAPKADHVRPEDANNPSLLSCEVYGRVMDAEPLPTQRSADE